MFIGANIDKKVESTKLWGKYLVDWPVGGIDGGGGIPAELTAEGWGVRGGIDCVDPWPCHGPRIKNKNLTPLESELSARLNFCSCDSGGIQTHNLLIRSQMLYSVELRNQSVFCFAGAKVHTFSELTKCFGDFF